MTDTFPITVSRDKELFVFEVAEQFDEKTQHIKYNVFLGGNEVAMLESVPEDAIWLCSGKLDEELLRQVLGKIEAAY